MQKNNANLDFLKSTFKTLEQTVEKKPSVTVPDTTKELNEQKIIEEKTPSRTRVAKNTIPKNKNSDLESKETVKINAFIKKDIYDQMLKVIYQLKIDGEKNINITRIVNEGIGLYLKKYAVEK